jgi:hypothetical protein
MGQKYIRVFLHSGTRLSPLGNQELTVFCPGNNEETSLLDVDTEGLLKWVNNNPGCKKNQSNEKYRISDQADAMSIVYLKDREIQACLNANRIYPGFPKTAV